MHVPITCTACNYISYIGIVCVYNNIIIVILYIRVFLLLLLCIYISGTSASMRVDMFIDP